MIAQRHEHAHRHDGQTQARRFALAFALTAGVLLVELSGGLVANSLALLSDAGHVLTDIFALGLGWFAAVKATQPANARQTWGYQRVGIVAALVNAVTLAGITLFIIYEAVGRLRHPEHVSPLVMAAAALFGIAVNLIIARILGDTHTHAERDLAVHDLAAGTHEHDLNTRAALLHVLGDVGVSAGVVVGAIIIALTGLTVVDVAVSLAVALVLGLGAWRVGREAVNVLTEATPRDISTSQLAADLRAMPGIYNVHHLHVWGITPTRRALSCHAVIDDVPLSQSTHLLERINVLLRERYRINHATVQFEERGICQDGDCDASDACTCEMDPVAHVH